MLRHPSLVRRLSLLACAFGLGVGVANAQPAAPGAARPPSAPAAPSRAPTPPAAASAAGAPAAPHGPAAAAAVAGGAKSRVITISEVTIVGRIQKPIASVDVSRIQPKLTLAELRQPFLQRIEDAVYRAPF